jgi:hypothetical protein
MEIVAKRAITAGKKVSRADITNHPGQWLVANVSFVRGQKCIVDNNRLKRAPVKFEPDYEVKYGK